MEKAFEYLQQGKELALATSVNGDPRLRVFQVVYFSLKADLVDFFDLTTTPPHISKTYEND